MRRRRDIDDDDLFEEPQRQERIRRRAATLEAVEKNRRDMELQEAAMRQRSAESLLRASERIMMAEYDRAGVDPPCVNGDGAPTCSIEFLKLQGWTIAIDPLAGNRMVPPPPRPKQPTPQRPTEGR